MPLSKHCSNATGNNVMPIYLLDYHICALISYTNTLSYSLSVFLYSLFSFYSLKRRKKKFHIVIFIFFSTLSLSNTQRQMTKWTKCNNAIHIKDVKVAARATQWNRIMCIHVSFFMDSNKPLTTAAQQKIRIRLSTASERFWSSIASHSVRQRWRQQLFRSWLFKKKSEKRLSMPNCNT